MIKADERDVRSLCALFMLGSIVIIGGTAENASRSWLSLVLSVTIALPLLALWVWILGRFPDKDLFGVLGELFGKWGGKLFAGLIGVYAFITLSWTLGNYTSFTTMLTSRDTVKEVPGMLVAAAAAVVAGLGFRVLRGAGRIFLTFMFIALGVTIPLSILSVDFSAFPLPIFGHDRAGVFEGALSLGMMPFGEVIILLAALPPPGRGKRGRGLLVGALMAFCVMLVVFLRNVMMLGERSMDCLYFHSFYALRILGIGSFFQRMEILVSVVYMCSDLLRIALCIYCCGRVVSECLGLPAQKGCYGPWAVMAFAASEMVLINGQAVFVFRELCKYIALPFCVGIPLACAFALFLRKNEQSDGKLWLKS
ncbi:MAG: GerAB/ArcD/ProY family transporter [Clostridia bacterium]|nr:GerAB/ArcD/ProY family transporter [Clostridia bacterium]